MSLNRAPALVLLVPGLLILAGPVEAQEPAGCPAVEEEATVPVELRFGDLVLRARVASGANEAGDGTRVEGRLVGCERTEAEADVAPDVAPVLRLLHDLRLAFELAPVGEDGRCIRAGIEVSDAAGELAGTGSDGPVAVELCVPFRLERPAAGPEEDG
jgi:hypothetical protein